jgi:hypothetical protein
MYFDESPQFYVTKGSPIYNITKTTFSTKHMSEMSLKHRLEAYTKLPMS